MSLLGAKILFGTDGITLNIVDSLEGPGEEGGSYLTTHSGTTGTETRKFNELKGTPSFSVNVPADTAAQLADIEAVSINTEQTITVTRPTGVGASTKSFSGACIGRSPAYALNARNVVSLTVQPSGAIT